MDKKNLGKMSHKIALFMLASSCAFTASELAGDQEPKPHWKWGDTIVSPAE